MSIITAQRITVGNWIIANLFHQLTPPKRERERQIYEVISTDFLLAFACLHNMSIRKAQRRAKENRFWLIIEEIQQRAKKLWATCANFLHSWSAFNILSAICWSSLVVSLQFHSKKILSIEIVESIWCFSFFFRGCMKCLSFHQQQHYSFHGTTTFIRFTAKTNFFQLFNFKKVSPSFPSFSSPSASYSRNMQQQLYLEI